MTSLPTLDAANGLRSLQNIETSQALSTPASSDEAPAASDSLFGEIRLIDLESACEKVGLPNPAQTAEDRALLRDVFDSWRNLNLDSLPLYLAFSIHRDLNDWEERIAGSPDHPKKNSHMKSLVSLHTNFCRVCMKFFQDLTAELVLEAPDPVALDRLRLDFCAQLNKLEKLFSLIPHSPQTLSIRKKFDFWKRIASHPEYPILTDLHFVVIGSRERRRIREEESQMRDLAARKLKKANPSELQALIAQQSPADAAPDRTKISDRVAAMPTLEETLAVLQGEVEFSLGHYQDLKVELSKQQEKLSQAAIESQNAPRDAALSRQFTSLVQSVNDLEASILQLEDPGTYLKDLQLRLRLIREAPPEKRASLAAELVGSVEKIKAKILTHRKKTAFSPVQAALSKEYYYLLHRITSSLSVFTMNLSLRLTTLRLHNNLQAHLDVPRKILSLPCNDPLKKRFLSLYDSLERKLGWKKSFEKWSGSFSASNWQEFHAQCRNNGFHTFEPNRLLGEFQKLHDEYSQIASNLYHSGDIKGAAALKQQYFDLCSLIAPTFFSNLDIRNLIDSALVDTDVIIPDEILSCFDLDIESVPDEIGPLREMDEDSSDEEEKNPPDSSSLPLIDPSPPATPAPFSPPVPREHKQVSKVKPTAQAPRPALPGRSISKPALEDSVQISRREIPKKLRKLRKWIRDRFYEAEGGRHRKIVDDDGKQVSVMSRSGKAGRKGIPTGTFHAIAKQLTRDKK